MKEYYKKKKEEARQQMSVLCETPVENSWRGILEALVYVKRHAKTVIDIERAKLIANMWSHFDCELMTLEENNMNN